MKKFWMITMLLIAALFFVSCGGDDDEGDNKEGENTCTENAFRCNDKIVQTCKNVDGELVWKNVKQCNAEETCNQTTGNCDKNEPEQPTDTGDTTETDTGDTTETDTGDTQDNPDTGDTTPKCEHNNQQTECYQLFMCLNDCEQSDQDCANACFQSNTEQAYNDYLAFFECRDNKGHCLDGNPSNNEILACIEENCCDEANACSLLASGGSTEPADETYKSPYGSAEINFSTDYIRTPSDSNTDNSGVVGPYATGTFGNNGTPISSTDSYAYALNYQNQQLQILQDIDGEHVLLILFQPVTNAAVGSGTFGVESGSTAMVWISKWDQSCDHAVGVGNFTITAAEGLSGGAGSLALTGNVTFYSPKNYPNYGDITGAFSQPVTACDPM